MSIEYYLSVFTYSIIWHNLVLW